jgi:hypothetical protein
MADPRMTRLFSAGSIRPSWVQSLPLLGSFFDQSRPTIIKCCAKPS